MHNHRELKQRVQIPLQDQSFIFTYTFIIKKIFLNKKKKKELQDAHLYQNLPLLLPLDQNRKRKNNILNLSSFI